MIRTVAFVLALAACGSSRSRSERDASPIVVDAAASDAPDRPTLVLPAVSQRPGTSATVESDTHLDFDITLLGRSIETRTTLFKRKQVAIVRVDPDGTVVKRITYLERKLDVRVNGEPQPRPSPLTGKTFEVTWRGSELEVRRASGKDATPDEVAAVKDDEGKLQSPEFLASHLAGLRLVQDVPYEVPVATVNLLISGDFIARKLVLTYRGKQGDDERIDVQASLSNETEATGWFIDFQARVVIDHTGWCTEVVVEAQARAELNGGVIGRGTGGGTLRASPLQ